MQNAPTPRRLELLEDWQTTNMADGSTFERFLKQADRRYPGRRVDGLPKTDTRPHGQIGRLVHPVITRRVATKKAQHRKDASLRLLRLITWPHFHHQLCHSVPLTW